MPMFCDLADQCKTNKLRTKIARDLLFWKKSVYTRGFFGPSSLFTIKVFLQWYRRPVCQLKL